MIPEQQIQKTVVDTIIGEEIAFSIKNISNIFELLRKSMYNDKPTAVAREIISNAIDANIESGTDKKILIKFPTKLDQIFSVQDFGIGIDKERMLCLTAFGASTKINTNKQIGGYGLGIKSPWSISDQFTITTITGGIKYKYLCYLDDVGYGKAKELFAIPTDESSGTTIEIPVTNDDFIDRIKRQSELFWLCNPNKIIIDGNPELNIYDMLQHRVALRGFLPSNYHVFNWQEYGLGDKIIVLNGYVPYVIHHKEYNEWKVNREFTFLVKYDIGVLDIPATRETISNTKRNNKITGKIVPKIQQAIQNLLSFLKLRKEKDEQIALITYEHTPVKIPEETIDSDDVHSLYYKTSRTNRGIVKSDSKYSAPKSPTIYNTNQEIVVELDDSKKQNISFMQYAEHIMHVNPNIVHVYFVYNGRLDEREKRIFKVVPLHTFAPTPVKRQITKKPVDESTKEKENDEIFYVYGEEHNGNEKLENILKEAEKYRKIECFMGGIIDPEIKKHYQRLRTREASCEYGLILVNKGMMKYTKEIKSVEISDFTLSKQKYFQLSAAYLMTFISFRLRKSKIYKDSAILEIKEYLNNHHIIPSCNQFIQYTFFGKVIFQKQQLNDMMCCKNSPYKPDENKLTLIKNATYNYAKKLMALMTDFRYLCIMTQSSNLKDSIWEEYSNHILDIFKDYREMFK